MKKILLALTLGLALQTFAESVPEEITEPPASADLEVCECECETSSQATDASTALQCSEPLVNGNICQEKFFLVSPTAIALGANRSSILYPVQEAKYEDEVCQAYVGTACPYYARPAEIVTLVGWNPRVDPLKRTNGNLSMCSKTRVKTYDRKDASALRAYRDAQNLVLHSDASDDRSPASSVPETVAPLLTD